MGRRLPDKVVYRIRIHIEAGEAVPAIAEAVKVGKKTIYKMRLNLDIWGEPYAPSTVVLGRPRALLPYQEMVIYNVMVLSFLLTGFTDWFYRGFLISLKTGRPRIWMRCRTSYLTNLTPKSPFQRFIRLLRELVGLGRCCFHPILHHIHHVIVSRDSVVVNLYPNLQLR